MKLINYLFLLSIGVIWGANFLFNELAIQSIPPTSVATARASIGVIVLTVILQFTNKQKKLFESKLSNTQVFHLWKKLFFIAFFEATLPFFLLAWGQQHVDSGQAAILMGTIPIITTILTKLLIPGTVLNLGNLISVFLGFVGIVVLVGPVSSLSILSNITGKLAILTAAFSFSLALILIKKLSDSSPIRSARNLLLCASIQLIPISLLVDHPWLLRPSLNSLLSVLLLGSLCGGIAYMLYFVLIEQKGPTFTSFSNYLVPIFGTLFGTIFLHEAINLSTIAALLIIIMATVMNGLVKQGDK